jgi:CRP/FNR family transcriptional regulator, cyclic AMP receptor protein
MSIMTPREVLERVRGFPLRAFEPGEAVISQAGASGGLLFLAEGTVEIAIEDVVIVRVSEPGSVFGEIALLLDQPHTAAVTAVQPSSFHVVDDPQALFEAEPRVAIYIAQILARRLNAVNHLLVDARRRIAQTDEPAGPVMDVLRRMGHALQHHMPM